MLSPYEKLSLFLQNVVCIVGLTIIPLRYTLICQEPPHLKLLLCLAACRIPSFRLCVVIPSWIFWSSTKYITSNQLVVLSSSQCQSQLGESVNLLCCLSVVGDVFISCTSSSTYLENTSADICNKRGVFIRCEDAVCHLLLLYDKWALPFWTF